MIKKAELQTRLDAANNRIEGLVEALSAAGWGAARHKRMHATEQETNRRLIDQTHEAVDKATRYRSINQRLEDEIKHLEKKNKKLHDRLNEKDSIGEKERELMKGMIEDVLAKGGDQ